MSASVYGGVRIKAYSIGPKIGIDFRKARCVDSISESVLCASEWMHGALGCQIASFPFKFGHTLCVQARHSIDLKG
ncbi:hypothetical protein FF124_16080 [Martelella lutilitoris]|uniref:Uncharacterized protein n=1 Tax=Martelella lutilitoris TaxID=2583532 RepID=A0A5C4JPE8_9HYPH|nr:hypothetical protein FF124_16080 [Martelella lutilitoris]